MRKGRLNAFVDFFLKLGFFTDFSQTEIFSGRWAGGAHSDPFCVLMSLKSISAKTPERQNISSAVSVVHPFMISICGIIARPSALFNPLPPPQVYSANKGGGGGGRTV